MVDVNTLRRNGRNLVSDIAHAAPSSHVDFYSHQNTIIPGIEMPEIALASDVFTIPKNRLIPGPNRPLDQNNVKRLIRYWDDRKVGVLEVYPSLEQPGCYTVMIGGHRLQASLALPFVTTLRCRIHKNITNEDSAELWRSEAKDRKNPTSPDLFWNGIIRKDKSHLEILRLIENIGREPAKTRHSNDKNVVCFSALLSLHKRNYSVLRHIFPLVGELCHGRIFNEMVVRGIFALQSNLLIRDSNGKLVPGGSLTEPRWKSRLIRIGFDQLVSAMVTSKYNTRGGNVDKPWARAICELINKNLQPQNRLIASGINEYEAEFG